MFTDLNDQHKAYVDSDQTLFEGNPRKKIVTVKKEGEEEGAEDGGAAVEEENPEGAEGQTKEEHLSDLSEEEEIKVPPKDLTELDRLVYVVLAIENDC